MTYCIMHDSEDTNGDGFCKLYATATPEIRKRLLKCITDSEGRAKRVKGLAELMKEKAVRESLGTLVTDALIESLDEYAHLLERMDVADEREVPRPCHVCFKTPGHDQDCPYAEAVHASWCEEGPNHPGECKP